jgi:hypothetical protein
LYVSRKVLNAGAIVTWAKAQGFTSLLPAGDMHVTVTYSRDPVPAIDRDAKPFTSAGGKRRVERIGDEGAVALMLDDATLQSRHSAYREAGASHDYAEYTPHITLTYQGGNVDLANIEPFKGPVVLGAEKQEALNEDKASEYEEVAVTPAVSQVADATRFAEEDAAASTKSNNDQITEIIEQ